MCVLYDAAVICLENRILQIAAVLHFKLKMSKLTKLDATMRLLWKSYVPRLKFFHLVMLISNSLKVTTQSRDHEVIEIVVT